VWVSRREAQLAELGALDETPRVTIDELIDLYVEHCQITSCVVGRIR
jgi:hypothetical protein